MKYFQVVGLVLAFMVEIVFLKPAMSAIELNDGPPINSPDAKNHPSVDQQDPELKPKETPTPETTASRSVISRPQNLSDDEMRVALVIGNERYDFLPRLGNPGNDARAISDLFRGMGFQTWMGLNLSQAQTLSLVREFAEKSNNAEILMFFYAGHAVQVSGRNYLFPVDAGFVQNNDVQDMLDQSVPVDKLLGVLEATSASTIVFLDACRNNPLSESTRGTNAITRGAGGLAPITVRAGTMINYATAPGAVSSDGNGDNSPFVEGILKHLATPGLPLEVALVRARADVAHLTDYQQIPWSHSSLLQEIMLVPGAYAALSVDENDGPAIQIDDQLAELLAQERKIEINGQVRSWLGADEAIDKSLWDNLVDGINFIEAGGRSFKLWVEGNTARSVVDAYSESYAILVAIDDYTEKSKFRDLNFMEENADLLAAQLASMGFPPKNIKKLYGPDATKQAIERELARFWGPRSDLTRSRLVFYYGGHGSHIERKSLTLSNRMELDGLLIPYDHDPSMPYKTSILLEDLRNKNLKRSRMHHTLVLIDACSSGLSLPMVLSDRDSAERQLHAPGRWATIQANLKQPHSAIIVAGTGEEKALWVNGGVFTKTLAEAFDGHGDINGDGLIQYEELYFTLLEGVRGTTRSEGVEQTPSAFDVGSGRIYFELPSR